MKTICWAYTEDGRVCRQPATVLDQQRGLTVCSAHAASRSEHNKKQNLIMSTKRTTPPNGASSASAPDQTNYRVNPEVEAKIDAYIKENPKYWNYLQTMPRERLERTVVLSEVRQIDRQQRMREGVMNRINANPDLKRAYETLVKNVPEGQREEVMTQLARQTQRVVARSQGQRQNQGEAVTV